MGEHLASQYYYFAGRVVGEVGRVGRVGRVDRQVGLKSVPRVSLGRTSSLTKLLLRWSSLWEGR